MKLIAKTSDGRFTVELEGTTQQELFEEVARFMEVFDDNVCKAKIKGEIVTSDKVVFRVRTDKDDNKYYEKVCMDWDKNLVGFKKSFGCHKKGGGLFPKDMPEENRIPGLNQWYKFVRDDQKEEVKEKVEETTPF